MTVDGLLAGWHITLALVVWLCLTGLWAVALVDALVRPAAQWATAQQNKVLWVVLVVFLGWLGAVLYLTIPRPVLKRVQAGT